MSKVSGTPVGDLTREATASRGGYLYQDYRVALEWLNLRADEILHVEVAEDYVKASGNVLLAAQIKDLSRKVTLNDADARRALASFVELVRLNPRHSIKYVFITTATASVEKEVKHRASPQGSLDYWAQTRKGSPVGPLRQALLAMNIAQEFRSFIDQRSDAELTRDLIEKFEWLVGERSIDQLHDQLSQELSQRLLNDYGIPRPDGRKYAGSIMLHVQRVGQLPRNKRRLNQAGMTKLLDEIATRTIGIKEYEELTTKAAIAGNLPVDVLDERIEGRILALRNSRNFIGYDKLSIALNLATDVSAGGQYAGASPSTRARAMAWAARVLIDDQSETAARLIDAAKSLDSGSESVRQAEAFLLGSSDLKSAMAIVASLTSRESMTARYLLQRRAAKTDVAAAESISWFETTGLPISDLDEDGQAIVLSDLMHAGRWDEAATKTLGLGVDDINHPNLLLATALCELGKAVPEERRFEILNIPPLWDPLDFPLIDTAAGLIARARAAGLFKRLCNVANDMGLEAVEMHALEYVIWLTLAASPDDVDAKLELESRLSDDQDWARWIPLAVSSGIQLDKATVRERLHQRHARDGELGFHGARALLALLLSADPRTAIEDWPTLRVQLSPYFDKDFLISIEAQMYVRTGREADARKTLENLDEGEQANRVRRHIEIMLAKSSGDNILAMRRTAYQESNGTFDLEQLIIALAAEKQWTELTGYTREMFSRSKTLDNAERHVDSLRNANSWDDLVEFLGNHPEFAQRSGVIAEVRTYLALFQGNWADVHESIESGRLSRKILENLRPQLSILSLQWHEFNAQIDEALADQEEQSADALLQLSAIAATLGRKADSKLLTVKATTVAPESPTILMSAFLQATKGMWESEQKVGHWLKSAIELSGEDGPLQKKSLVDLVELAPRWREQNETAWSSLQAGNIWLAAYGKIINQQLSHLTSGAAIANRTETDVRRRAVIPAFSGHRQPLSLAQVRKVALDPTALMTLASTGMIGSLEQVFEKVYVPYYTGAWLFEEFQESEFHQPRRIEEARQLLSYVAQDKIRVCPKIVSERGGISAHVGTELADLLQHAHDMKAAGQSSFVVRVAPVHFVSSLLEKEADLSEHTDILRSVLCTVDSLEVLGAISNSEKEAAQGYLRSVDRGWDADAELPSDALLLLDDLSINYLQHVGLLEKLVRSQFKLMIHEEMREQAKNYESVRESRLQLHGILTAVRDFLARGIRGGFVEVLPAPRARWGRNQEAPTPSIDLFELTGDMDGIIVDDRFFNRYLYLEREGRPKVAVHCSLDLIDFLLDLGKITESQWLSCRSDLRRGGYAHIPISEKELASAAAATQVRSGRLVESVDLRAIRENVALVQMRGVLQLPLETAWLTGLVDACKNFLDSTLRTADEGRDLAFLNWTIEIADLRKFGNKFQGEMHQPRWRALGLMAITRLLMESLLSEPADERKKLLLYEVFDPLAWRDPAAHSWLLDQIKRGLRDMSDDVGSTAEDERQKAYIKLSITRAINQLPLTFRKALLEDRRFIRALGLELREEIQLNVAEGPRFERNNIWMAVARVTYFENHVRATDTAGKQWELDRDEEGHAIVRLSEGALVLVFPDIEYMAMEPHERLAHFREKCRAAGIDPSSLSDLESLLTERPLSPSEVEDAQLRFEEFPIPLCEKLHADFSGGKTTLSDLFPVQFSYYQRLVGDWKGEASILDFAMNRSLEIPEDISLSTSLDLKLLLSGHSSTVPVELVAAAGTEELKEFLASNVDVLDIWSLTGLLETIILREDSIAEFGDELLRLLEAFSRVTDADSGRLEMAVALCKTAENRIRAIDADESLPPYWRRLAAIAHAALIERSVLRAGGPNSRFTERIESLDGFYNTAGIVDMRREPRWAPFLMVDHQLKQELIGRVVNAWSIHFESAVASDPRFNPVISSLTAQKSILSASPGPLEGNATPNDLPPELSQNLELLLADDTKPALEIWPYVATVGFIGALPIRTHKALLAQVERSGRDAFVGSDEGQIAEVLVRLAFLAATSRNASLARALVDLSREMSADSGVGISTATCLLISSVSIAAYDGREEWTSELTGCVNYAANTCSEKADANECLSVIDGFIAADWTLGPILARSKVALGTVLNKS